MMLLRLPLLFLLTSCAASLPVTRMVTLTPQVPAPLLKCAPAPGVPVTTSQAVVAQYIVALWQAGQDCRAHVAAIQAALAH
jgi:hypothetical protein